MHPSYDPSQLTSLTRQVRILGRTDDLIVLATGEKVRPTMMEQRAGLGVIVELVESTLGSGSLVNASTAEKEEMIRSLEPFVERGNSYTDAHGKISTNPLNMIIVTSSSTKPLIRMDKGSLARKANYAAFEEEIQGCYDSQGAEEETAAILREQTSSFLRQGMRWTFSRLGWIVYRLRGCGFYCRVSNSGCRRLRRSKAGSWGGEARDARRPYLKRRKAWEKAVMNFFKNWREDGWIYVFFNGFFEGNAIFKLGKTNNLCRRMPQWNFDCPNPGRIWLEAFWAPNAIRTESLLHIALEELCEQRPRFMCKCGTAHIEKFGFKGCPLLAYKERI
ncbi:hypothetical protein BT96DRAFT_1073437 [Gymnopus androsaceus JB14]|uniref:Bacteriophage T5 Orf172 DNA-binding domain-containing protein n=1 Tax=Gymnopus androsaceus JB14 TaxID=1447944 RepID=A0A6A4GRV5_9AGAR|nr:hypothetical protein BT96DRAFT_1073437 [Gymnopus androsaceus JB14]